MKNIVILFGLPVLAAMTSFAGNVCTWSGRAGNGSWKDAGNWDTKPVDGNGDTVVLVNAGAEAITIENDIGAMSLYSLRFGAGSFFADLLACRALPWPMPTPVWLTLTPSIFSTAAVPCPKVLP